MRATASIAKPVVWRPQTGPQKVLIDCRLPLVFFGGARGGGKTDAVLGKWSIKAGRRGSMNGVLFRRELPMLDDAIARSQEFYPQLGAKWADQKKTWRFPSGARIRFRPLRTVSDADKYQGQNISDMCIEEAGQYPDPAPIDRLFGALRGDDTQMLMTGNPGGAGQFWIKSRHIDPHPSGMRVMERQIAPGLSVRWMFIPSRLRDNHILMKRDPQYQARLHLVGNEKLVKAWLDGDWNAVEGQFFAEWRQEVHVIRPFTIPDHWMRFRAFDWGSAAPFCCLWIAVSDGTCGYPRDALVVYREWYGAELQGGRWAGVKLTTEEVGAGIVQRTAGEKITYSVADPAIFARDGGPSRAEVFMKSGVVFRRADNRRISDGKGHLGGWDEMRNRLKGRDGVPMLYFFSTCEHTIRTVPVLQHDSDRAEDLDTDSEDHAADTVRYACMSRPWVQELLKPKMHEFRPPTFDEMLKSNRMRLER